MRIGTMNAPDMFARKLAPVPEGSELSPVAPYDHLTVFVNRKAELDRFALGAMKSMRPGGILWFAYLKKASGAKSDVTRDDGWDTLTRAGWGPVSLIAIDGTWSALRFRPLTREEQEDRASRKVPLDEGLEKKPSKPKTSVARKPPAVPTDLTAALAKNKKAKQFFETLAPSHAKEYIVWITEAKKDATRETRIAKAIEKLLQKKKNPTVK